MKRIKTLAMAAAMGLVFGGAAYAADSTGSMTKDQYKTSKDQIEANYKSAKQRCDSMSGNSKDVCQKEAKGQEKIDKADLEARYKNTDHARREAQEAKADAQYDIAKEKCDDMNGNQKDVCVKDAKAAHEQAKADIKSTAGSGRMGASTSAASKRHAQEDATDAKYEAAKERCDSLSGDAKDRCEADAKARYHQ
jgi:chromosome segregation ATPase